MVLLRTVWIVERFIAFVIYTKNRSTRNDESKIAIISAVDVAILLYPLLPASLSV
jgi:hypothetical protein